MNLEGIEKLDLIANTALNNHFDLESVFENCSHNTLENYINYYLNEIQKITNKVINIPICNPILEKFNYNYQISDEDTIRNNENIMEEANIVCDDLIKKITNSNGRSIKLPVSIESIIDYGISTYINTNDIDKLLYYVTIKLTIVYNFYKN